MYNLAHIVTALHRFTTSRSCRSGEYLYLCQLPVHLSLPPDDPDHLAPHSPLTHKDQEHEESSQEIQTINHPEKYLKTGGIFLTGVAVVTMDPIVEK